jgi:hypothetical protein
LELGAKVRKRERNLVLDEAMDADRPVLEGLLIDARDSTVVPDEV